MTNRTSWRWRRFFDCSSFNKISKNRYKKTIGTSLTIIAINSIVGFKSDLFSDAHIDWLLLCTVISFTCIGMVYGIRLSKLINNENLKRIFGYFIIIISILILIEQIISL
ncbi:MAG: sulfite exporter TauE/SafE family protein [Pelagibacterales bacterium]|nr:sulfite exporter TauE/SafE family protein [Pelagibacterales bacterium]